MTNMPRLAKRLLGHVFITNEGADITNIELKNGNVLVARSGEMIQG
jgi:hypothetical protein